MLAWSITAGLPTPLLHTAARIVRDELDHAALAHAALVALGGADTPVDLSADRLHVPAGKGLLADLSRAVLRDFCLGETLAVPYFAEMRRRATHPAVAPVLDRVLADEAAHRAFGWDALDALIALDPGVRPWTEARLPALRATFAAYEAPPDALPLTDAERACGLLDNAEYGALFARTWAEDIAPRFARRDIAA